MKNVKIGVVITLLSLAAVSGSTTASADTPALNTAPLTETAKRQARDPYLKRLRGLTRWLLRRNAPEITIKAAERIMRLYGLYRIDADEMLADLERLAAKIERGEARMGELVVTAQSFAVSLDRIEQRQSELERVDAQHSEAIAANKAAIGRLRAATAELNAAARRAKEAERIAKSVRNRLRRFQRGRRRYCGGKYQFSVKGRCLDRRMIRASD